MKVVLLVLLVAACGSVTATQDAGTDGTSGPGLTVAVTGDGTGHVTSMPGGIDCPGTCTASFAAGTSVTLMATADAGSVFAGYSGDCMGPDCSVSTTADKMVTAKFVISGEKRFAKQLDDTYLSAITLDKTGRLVVAGNLTNYTGMYLSSRSSTDGSISWETTFQYVTYPWLTTAPNGDIVLIGELTGAATMGGRVLNYNPGSADIVIARISPMDGTVTWVKELGGTNYDDPNAVVVTSDNTIVVGGTFQSPSLTIGTFTLADGSTSAGDAWLAAFAANGTVLWAKEYGTDTGNEGITGLTLDGNGNVVAAGYFNQSISFGANLNYTAAYPYADVFVATVRASDGVGLTGKQLGSTMQDLAEDIEQTGDGGYVLLGEFEGNQSFGGATITNHGQDDAFIARFTAGGAHAWSTGIGGTGADRAIEMALDTHGAMLITGYYYDAALDLGGGHMLPNAGMNDGFLVKLDSTGAYAWSRRFGGGMSDAGVGVVADTRDNVYAVGTFSGTADIGDDSFTSTTAASFLVSYYP